MYLCRVRIFLYHIVFKVLYKFWHAILFIYTILTYSCICIMFMLFFVSCHIFYFVLIIFTYRVIVSCLILSCLIFLMKNIYPPHLVINVGWMAWMIHYLTILISLQHFFCWMSVTEFLITVMKLKKKVRKIQIKNR